MLQVQLDDLVITVDEATAEALKDPEVAKDYLKQIKQQLKVNQNVDSPGSCSPGDTATTSMVWTTSKKTTKIDHEATLEFLTLRLKYDEDFKDKKTVNNDIWQKIANSMNTKGFVVGEGLAGREKCRQKFSNLQQSYLKYIDRRKRTGEGAIVKPPYFDELNQILGDKHKTMPAVVMDSLDDDHSESKQYEESICQPKPGPSSNHGVLNEQNMKTESSVNRFANIKKALRPKSQKSTVLEELLKVQKENQNSRRNEFQTLMNMFTEQSNKRHIQMMALIKTMKGSSSAAKGKKRKAESSGDDSSDESN